MQNNLLDSNQFISQLLRSPAERERAVLLLARNKKIKSTIRSYVKNNSGQDDDANTIFHDAIIIFVKKVYTQSDFQLEKGVEAYLYGIAKNLWANTLRSRSNNRNLEIENQPTLASEEDTLVKLLSAERKTLLEKVLATLGDKCRQVLIYWSYGSSMKEIAEKLNYTSDGMARKKKHQCVQKLKALINNNESLRNSLKY